MKNRTYSEDIANAIKDFLTEDDWNFSFDKERGQFKYDLTLKTSKIKNLCYHMNVHEDDYTVHVISPLGADVSDEAVMASMAEFVCRANYGLLNGNFELDMRDGEIRYKCFVDCEGQLPSREMIRNSIYCPATMFKRYSAGIVDVLFQQATAKEAVERCEKPSEESLRSFLEAMMDDEDGTALNDLLSELTDLLETSGDEEADDENDDYEEDDEDDEDPIPFKTDLFGTEGEDD